MKVVVKRSKWTIAIIVLGCFLTLLAFSKTIGIIQWYHIPTVSNDPGIRQGDWVWASNLKKPSLHSFIMFRRYDSTIGSTAVFSYRCMGMPGDTLVMRNSIMYVNGENADTGFEQKKMYMLSAENTKPFLEMINYKEDEFLQSERTDQALLTITTKEFKKLKEACKPEKDSIVRYSWPPMENEFGGFLFRESGGKWDLDNFGPIRVPIEHYFLLGDNRHNAMDSRFIGFVKKESVIGTALNK